MEFFDMLERIILLADPYEKIAACEEFGKIHKDLPKEHAKSAKIFDMPSYAAICTVVDPKDVPRRSRFGTDEGRAVLLHAIAHIEYSAIDLALDAAYRYRGMPVEFYEDWIEVALDECRHFRMIDALLHELGYKYGDFPVHQGLFDAARASLDLIDRMCVVPRYLEANGLDANPKIIAKLERFHDPFAAKMRYVLQIILDEEVGHVQKGDRWFRWACEKEGIEDLVSEYFKRVERIYPGTLHSKEFINVSARKAAGFSCDEIALLAKGKVECG